MSATGSKHKVAHAGRAANNLTDLRVVGSVRGTYRASRRGAGAFGAGLSPFQRGTEIVERIRVTFSGRVQGVGFRQTVRTIARALAVTGWVHNEPDGSVTAEIQGRASEINALLTRLRARLEDSIASESTEPMSVVEGEESFEIRR